MTGKKKSICLVTCYYDTNYIRTSALRDALRRSSCDVIHVANRSRGLAKYLEVILDLIKARLTRKPDVYFLTFRGYEMLPVVRLITLGKPLIFDEFINPIELVVHEQKIVKNRPLISVLRWGYRLWLKTVQAITTDTQSHAEYSAQEMNLSIDNYYVLPVGTDEQTFDFDKHSDVVPDNNKFQVFYYGSMLSLHGVEVVLEAMELLIDYEDIELLMVGGKERAKRLAEAAQSKGARVRHKKWIDYEQLPVAMRQSNVCLGGPFGDTVQSQFVITGKTYQQLSLGCPVIIGANKESSIFTDKKDIIIAEQGSADSLAESILWSYNNRDKLAEIGRGGRELYVREFSIDRLSRKTENLLARFFKDR